MYRWLRNTHLFLGVFSTTFVLMYGLSSVFMAHNRWFTDKPRTSESRHAVPAEAASDARSVARHLMERNGMGGEIRQINVRADGFSFVLARPGTFHEVTYSRPAAEARVKRNVVGFVAIMRRLHHIAGLWHDDLIMNLWGALLGVVSFGLIVLSLTGLYLWFKIHQERRIGVVLLLVNLLYSLPLIVLMRMDS